MICQKCGMQLADGTPVCPNCGNQLYAPYMAKPGGLSPLLEKVGNLLPMLGAIIGGFFFLIGFITFIVTLAQGYSFSGVVSSGLVTMAWGVLLAVVGIGFGVVSKNKQ